MYWSESVRSTADGNHYYPEFSVAVQIQTCVRNVPSSYLERRVIALTMEEVRTSTFQKCYLHTRRREYLKVYFELGHISILPHPHQFAVIFCS